jgi:hypothetical protein
VVTALFHAWSVTHHKPVTRCDATFRLIPRKNNSRVGNLQKRVTTRHAGKCVTATASPRLMGVL